MPAHEAPLSALTFELLAEIAVGETATVELCRVTKGPLEDCLVAVKRLHPHIADDPQFSDMFRDEIWMAQALQHKHVVRVVGWGEDEFGRYLASEFVRGVSLQRLMKTIVATGEHFSERMVVYLAASVCGGLAEAHALRGQDGQLLELVHRDLTPGNILLGFDGAVGIIDFGLAKAKQRLTRTMTGVLKGKPLYMAPEQLLDQHVDARSDIFSLGVVLFETFSGQLPWSGTNQIELMRAMTETEPADLMALRPKMDRALGRLVAKCLARNPEDRYQSAVALREELMHWLRAHGYQEGNQRNLSRFIRRNAMRQMRWFEKAIEGAYAEQTRQEREARLSEQYDGTGFERAPISVGAPVSLRPPEPRESQPQAVADDEEETEWRNEPPTLIQSGVDVRRSGQVPTARATMTSSAPTEKQRRKEEGEVEPPLSRQSLQSETAVVDREPRPVRAETETLVAIDEARAGRVLDETATEPFSSDKAQLRLLKSYAELGDGPLDPEARIQPSGLGAGVHSSGQSPVQSVEFDYDVEARRVAHEVRRFAAKASLAQDLASYAEEAADFAAEAARLAREGRSDAAQICHEQSQQILTAIERGRIPRRPRQLEGADEPLLTGQQIVTLAVVLAVSLVLSMAIAALW